MTPEHIVDKLTELYDASVARLQVALRAFIETGQKPDPASRSNGDFAYPELRDIYDPDGPPPPISRAFAKLSEPGVYASTITQPRFFRQYLISQLQ